MQNYNTDILKRNIKRLMEEHKPKKTTQEELAAIAGVQQTRVSKILSNSSDCFTIPQLVDIAEYFHISVDELLGIKKPNEEKNSIESLSDIADMFFRLLHADTGLSFKNIRIPANPNSLESNLDSSLNCYKERTAIYFNNKNIDSFLAEWEKIYHAMNGVSCKSEMLSLWENNRIDILKANKSIYGYDNIIGYGKSIYEYAYRSWCEEDPVLISKEELEILKYYVDACHKDVSSYGCVGIHSSEKVIDFCLECMNYNSLESQTE